MSAYSVRHIEHRCDGGHCTLRMGESSADEARAAGFKVGDVLVGTEGFGGFLDTSVIRIDYIGQGLLVCTWLWQWRTVDGRSDATPRDREGTWTLSARCWGKLESGGAA